MKKFRRVPKYVRAYTEFNIDYDNSCPGLYDLLEYDPYFQCIEEVVTDMGLTYQIVQDGVGLDGNHYRTYALSNGYMLDTYELETWLISEWRQGHRSVTNEASDIRTFIENQGNI